PGRSHQRTVRVEARHVEAGLGQGTGEIAGAAAHVQHADLTPLEAWGHRFLDQFANLGLEPLIVAESRIDVVVDHAITDCEHAIEPATDPADIPGHRHSTRFSRHRPERTLTYPGASPTLCPRGLCRPPRATPKG